MAYETLTSGPDLYFALGTHVTLAGGAGNDTMTGSTGADRLMGQSGDDDLFGGAQHDTLGGGSGNDRLYGGNGLDRLLGGPGDDLMDGGNDGDVFWMGAGNDTILGGSGNDMLIVGGVDGVRIDLRLTAPQDTGRGLSVITGIERIHGGDGADFLHGGSGLVRLFGHGGNDTLQVDNWWARIEGGDGDDLLTGGRLFGEAGNDSLTGFQLHGGTGDDLLQAVSGRQSVLFLDAGNDTLIASGDSRVSGHEAEAALTIDLRLTIAQDTGVGIDLLQGVSALSGSKFSDLLIGSSNADWISGGGGNDTVLGLEGNDTLSGGGLTDGGAGDDLIGGGRAIGGAGNDTITGGMVVYQGDADVTVDLRKRFGTSATDGHDTLTRQVRSIATDGGDDLLYGQNTNRQRGNNLLDSGAGNDTLFGMNGADTLLGGSGADVLVGGWGTDLIDGGLDLDVDRFVFGSASYNEVVRNFVSGIDIISLVRVDANRTLAGNQDLVWAGTVATARSVWVQTVGADTWVYADTSGDTSAEIRIRLEGVTSVSESDFWL